VELYQPQGNAAKYDAEGVRTIKKRIKQAAKKHGVEIDEG
jgi:type III secretion system FlhB-like substrate exporter